MAPRRRRDTLLGHHLRALRSALKTNQEGLASLLYVSARTVSRWENGGAPTPDQVNRLIDLAGRVAPAVHDGMATLFGYELTDPPPVLDAPPTPLAPLPPPAPARPPHDELRAALDGVVYAASEERDLLPRHLRAFGVELLQSIDRLGLSAKEAAELLAVRDRAKTKTDDATPASTP